MKEKTETEKGENEEKLGREVRTNMGGEVETNIGGDVSDERVGIESDMEESSQQVLDNWLMYSENHKTFYNIVWFSWLYG